MLSIIYEFSGITVYFILTMLLTSYIFRIPPLKSTWQQVMYMLLSWAVCLLACAVLGKPAAIIMMGISLGGYIYLTGDGKKRRYFRILELFPIIGICFGLILPAAKIPVMLIGLEETPAQIYSLTLYGLLLIAMLVFFFRGSAWRRTFREDRHSRHLEHWEQSLLYVIGVLMFLLASPGTAYETIADASYRRIVLQSSCISSFICFIVTLTIIILILQGNKSAHFQEQVLKMQHNIIITMADIIENRDENTGGHIRRTAKYVEIVSRRMQEENRYSSILNEQYIADMMIAAPLHDIGKIHIPDVVLKKEGRFNDAEYEIMKEHSAAGRRLLLQAEKTLGASSYLDIAVKMAAYHHEWWDGSGYPEGLKGQDIPLCARIMAVADVFDALVSKRCYKEAMPPEEAFDIIRKESGTHFDPIVAEAFLSARTEILAVLQELTETA